MRKRLIALLMTLAVLASMMPVTAAATVSERNKAAIQTAVEKVLKDHAQKVYQPDADDDAVVDFLIHAFFGNFKDMVLNDSSAQTAALMNSCLLQNALPRAITEGIVTAMETREDTVTVSGDLSWHNYYYSYNFTAYEGDEFFNTKYTNKADHYRYRLRSLITCDSDYGKGGYKGAKNQYDEVQELLSGSLWARVLVRRVETKKDTMVFQLDLFLQDDFDFEGDYDDLAKKGYDTSKDSRLKKLGLLMTTMGIDEFYWYYKKSFTVEVPYACDHRTGAYHWEYDAPTMTLTSAPSEGFLANDVERRVYNYTTKDANGGEITKDRIYYGLMNPIQLKHDRPWVIEYEWKGAKNLQLSPYRTTSSTRESFYFYSIYNMWMYYQETVKLPDGQKNENGSTSNTYGHYVGTALSGKFKYNSKHTYTYTLENAVNPDGSNMIYASVYDHDLGETVFGPEAMDDHWVLYPKATKRTLVSENDRVLSGRDFYINYIGSTSVGLSNTGEMDLRIYENGRDAESESSVSTKENVAATCTQQGGMKKTCADCGYTYFTDAIAALGHSYGEYVSDNNASCTENGTQTRVCARCNGKDTVAEPDTVLGHAFGAYIYNKDASCTEDGTQTRTCSRCAAGETKDAPNTATGHTHQPSVTAPTCTAQGYTTYTCHCGDKYVTDYVDATGHSHKMTIVAPTCTEQGYTVYTCHCGDSYQADYTDALGHSPVIDAAVPASCVGNGLTEGSHCGVCGYVIKAQTAVVGGTHLKDEGTIVKEATYDTPGTVMYQCIYCGEKSYVVIPKLEPMVNPFTDVKESDWFYKPVMWAVNAKVTGGKTATTFAPYEGCTRAQVVTFLWAANGKPMSNRADSPFVDIKSTDWYYNAVLWAVENGITGGVSADRFGPDQTCTRAQIATFLWAAKGKPAVDGGSAFSDVKDGDWFAAPVIWAKENGITDGIGGGKFGPNDTCTRAQVVTFLNKVYQ